MQSQLLTNLITKQIDDQAEPDNIEESDESTAESHDNHQSPSITKTNCNLLKNPKTYSSLSGAKLKKSIDKHQTPKTLVLGFWGFGSKPENFAPIKATFKRAVGNSKVNFYGEDKEKERLHYYNIIRTIALESPIKEDVKNFVDRACKEFTDGSFKKVICITHSLGAHILSEVLAEMNDRYKTNEDEVFKEFYQSFSEILLNRPFVSNKFSSLRGWSAVGSVFCKNVETNKEEIVEFVKNNKSNIKLTFTLSPKDEVIDFESQLIFCKYFENANIINEVKQERLGHNDYVTTLELSKQQKGLDGKSCNKKAIADLNISKNEKAPASSFASTSDSSKAKSTTPILKEVQSFTSDQPRQILPSPQKLVMSGKITKVNLQKESVFSV